MLMTVTSERLNFVNVDALAFAAMQRRIDWNVPTRTYAVTSIGPLLELLQLSTSGLLPTIDQIPCLKLDAIADFWLALGRGKMLWISPTDRQIGFFRTASPSDLNDSRWVEFCLVARKAAVSAGFHPRI